jgi:hypothetical protein
MDKRKLELERERQRAIGRAQAEASTKMGRENAQAWDSWIDSEEGRSCSSERGCYGEYLRNRLWRAFMAGANSKPSGSVD